MKLSEKLLAAWILLTEVDVPSEGGDDLSMFCIFIQVGLLR